ncbi:DUF2493 domain-containing protein [Winogradskyella wichelsiae]|uniref:DUF2493 domain-containing protein n=1 Tax=Winogradskyella wichelsiae TaxID=2697007 RepID=UPI003EF416D2
MKIIIAGGRSFKDYEKLHQVCTKILSQQNKIEIVSGTANGADKLGEKFATDNGFSIKKFSANWDKFGKSAGYIRNAEMAEYADALIAFWDKKSRGTLHMINLAKRADLKIRIIYY